MSSSRSKIIKRHAGAEVSVAEFTFEPIAGAPRSPQIGEGGGFVPLVLCEGVPAEGSADRVDPFAPVAEEPPEEPQEPFGATCSEAEVALRVEEAYREGMAEGRRQAEADLAHCCTAMGQAVSALHEMRDKIMRESEGDLLELSMAVARKIIQQEIASDRTILARLVATAVNSAAGREDVVIRLNPDDYRLVAGSERLTDLAEVRRMTLKPDENIPCGGCVVDTPMGEIDARIEAQLDEVYRHIMEERGVICSAAQHADKE